MVETKRIVCLANSRKGGAHCVAGREIVGNRFGGWLRPVGGSNGAVSTLDRCYADGSEPALGDAIELSLSERERRRDHQQENWMLDRGKPWERLGRVPWRRLIELTEGDEPLWINDAAAKTNYGLNNCIFASRMRGISTSLRFIRVQGLRLYVERNRRDPDHDRLDGRFTLGAHEYRLAVTDPVYEAEYGTRRSGSYDLSECLLTISLSEPFRGRCYKLIAGIIERERYE